jgi:phospholipid transport system transporter-binding protein
MSELFTIQFDKDSQTYQVSGELTLDTARAVKEDTDKRFATATAINIDLSKVSRADSAGLALLVAWMRQAKASDKAISFRHVPAQMLAIANASGLDVILPIK